ncbi:Leucine-rich repeat and calponin like proteiny domain-containing protein 1 [Chelonia mydas]|uniref:Leucine-rich repeat and calponin like proteiny domain-containing protein 1 n=1 Tax=Chelonia mydas TaxID=8469 RepID=M7BLZ5_CHEMY|nr:Leucine-rich repeat and calponin like proteiny domain-containing protein 1 [Chelonia mydas]
MAPALEDNHVLQELLRRAVRSLGLQAEEEKEDLDPVVDILAPSGPSRVALPLIKTVVDMSKNVWQTPASLAPMAKKAERRYFIPSLGYENLYTHPPPDSLVVDVANQRERQGFQGSTPKSRDAKKLDLFGRKVCLTGGLQLRIAKQQAIVSSYGHNTCSAMAKFAEFLPQDSQAEFSALVEEGKLVSLASLQAALDAADAASRTLATGVVMRGGSWLQVSGLSHKVVITFCGLSSNWKCLVFLPVVMKDFDEQIRKPAKEDSFVITVSHLSKNRLTDVPMELCHFVSLETLNLYHNCIKIIPDAIVNLQMLTYLNLSRNQLSSLPACLCGLPLKVLIASNNKLGSLPEEIGQLKQLMELDVSCNEITALPQQIGQLKSLRELNIRRNYLKVLPQELVELPLVKFDFSCNKVLVIPVCFRKMVQLQVLLLENNPLQSPPAQICIKGKVHIFKYLSIQACQIKTADSLYLNAIERPHLQQPVEESIDDIYPSKKDSDSGVGSDNGDKRLSATEPSDEDTVSLNVPMSNIMEEDQIIKEDTGHHINLIQAPPKPHHRPPPHHTVPTHPTHPPHSPVFVVDAQPLMVCCVAAQVHTLERTQGREAECDELLRIEEDTHWQTEGITNTSNKQSIDIAMIDHLKEAVDLLQDPNSGQMQMEEAPIYQSKEKTPTQSPTTNNTAPFGLKPRSVFLRPQRNLESIDPQFTIRRKMEQMREERELVEQLRENIEMRLKICLPEDLGSALMDGVVLCHLVNHIRPRSVGSIHVPSPAVPKLSMAKCRRNVENFLDACRKLGIPEEKLCLPHHILEEKGLVKVSITVQALLEVTTMKQALFT